MATVVACVIAVVLIVGLGALAKRIQETRSVVAAEELVAARPPEQVDAELRAALGTVTGARVSPLQPGHVRVVIRRSPVWTVLVAVVAFPIGLAALLHREDVALDVWVYRSPDGTRIQLSGPTEAHVLARVRAAVLSVPGVSAGQAVGV